MTLTDGITFWWAFALVGLVGVLACLVIPGRAKDRMMFALVGVRDDLETPGLRRDPDVRRLDEVAAYFLETGGGLGMGWLLLAWWRTRGDLSQVTKTVKPVTYSDLTDLEERFVSKVEHRAMYEILRATTLGGSFWWLTWPAWISIKHRLGEIEARRHLQAEDRAEQTIFIGAALQQDSYARKIAVLR